MFITPKKKDSRLCAAYRCSNARPSHDKFCPKHRKREQKETNTAAYHFNILRSNARRRGKEFNLTLGEFKQFCQETDYLKLKGKRAKSASIDRIDPSKGYEIGNIQVLSLAENSRKQRDDCPF